MKQLHYSLVDVFTNQPFGGNQLAVFPDARGLAPETMQALAKELNLSESAFVLPAQDAASDYRACGRIAHGGSSDSWNRLCAGP